MSYRASLTVAAVLALLGAGGMPARGQEPAARQPAAPRFFSVAGVKDEASLTRILEALRKVPGVEQAEGRLRDEGGARIRIAGPAAQPALAAAVKDAGFELQPVSGPLRFLVMGSPKPEEIARLREALGKLEGIGTIRTVDSPRGFMIGFPETTVTAERIVATARAAGFQLQAVAGMGGGGGAPLGEGERNAPAALSERVLQDLTKVGDLAPDFTLITRDGKQKITLSDYRSKKPVVLIFGSYT